MGQLTPHTQLDTPFTAQKLLMRIIQFKYKI